MGQFWPWRIPGALPFLDSQFSIQILQRVNSVHFKNFPHFPHFPHFVPNFSWSLAVAFLMADAGVSQVWTLPVAPAAVEQLQLEPSPSMLNFTWEAPDDGGTPFFWVGQSSAMDFFGLNG
jgi:hypothetical protein